MVPGDHSVKNYRGTESMKVKLFPLDKPHVQRVVTAKIPIPRDTRNALKAVECHRAGARMLSGCGHIARSSVSY